MKPIAHRLAKLEAKRLTASADASAPMIEAAERAWSAAWAQAEVDEDGPFGARAVALLALHADLEREAAAAEARRAARLARR